MIRRAKIVCTLGPASAEPETLEKMITAGMNVARLNFSHGDHDYHRMLFDRVREISREMHRPVAILQDLQGPKIRVGRFADGSTVLEDGQEFVLTMDDQVEGDNERVSTTYDQLAEDVKPGDILLLDDGLLRLRVVDKTSVEVRTIVEIGGVLKNNKGH